MHGHFRTRLISPAVRAHQARPGTAVPVGAHRAWRGLTARRPISPICRGRFRINRVSAEHAKRWGSRHRSSGHTRLQEIAEDRHRPVGITDAHVLADITCPDLHIRRPLGRPCPMPPEPVPRTADLMADTGWPLAVVLRGVNARTVKGLRLIAQDLDRTHGEGFNMHGSVEALLLAAIRGATTRGS
jgi:hypothetical protein